MLLMAAALLVRRLPSGVARLRNQAEIIRQATTPAESVPVSAIDLRFRLRRAAVQAMRNDLVRLVAVESAFVVDSGHPTAFLPPSYAFRPSPGNNTPSIVLRRDGWSATIQSPNDFSEITCSVSVTINYDSAVARPIAAQPVCVGAQEP
ncbi:MAG TPA: hypothetical protein VJ816_09440 [Gemmatimonadales bacterium]|nr:hypothetical protein [Gemmatimonadales bacterium]